MDKMIVHCEHCGQLYMMQYNFSLVCGGCGSNEIEVSLKLKDFRPATKLHLKRIVEEEVQHIVNRRKENVGK